MRVPITDEAWAALGRFARSEMGGSMRRDARDAEGCIEINRQTVAILMGIADPGQSISDVLLALAKAANPPPPPRPSCRN